MLLFIGGSYVFTALLIVYVAHIFMSYHKINTVLREWNKGERGVM